MRAGAGNELGDEGAIALAGVLGRLPNLQVLGLHRTFARVNCLEAEARGAARGAAGGERSRRASA